MFLTVYPKGLNGTYVSTALSTESGITLPFQLARAIWGKPHKTERVLDFE